MSSPINPNTSFSQDVRTLAKASDNKDSKPVGQIVSEFAHQKKASKAEDSAFVSHKKQLNAAIVESALSFSNSINDNPMSLVLKTALQGINDALKASGVETSVEETYQSGIDYSPEATAERIVSFSTQMFGSYKEQHPEMAEEEALTSFVEIIRGGIDQGFGEAKDILEGLKVLEGDIESNIETTYDFVQEGLKSFVDSFSVDKELE